MLLIIDYDETYTAAPVFWDMVICGAKEQGHTVVCCTMRFSDQASFNDDVITDMGCHDIQIVYAAHYKDKWDAIQAAGFVPENAIWIDDRPMFIFMDRTKDEYREL